MRVIIYAIIIVLGFSLVYRMYKRTTNRSIGAYRFFSTISKYDKTVKGELAKRDRTDKLLGDAYTFTRRLKFLNHGEKRDKTLEYVAIRANMKWNGVELGRESLTAIINMVSLAWIALTLILAVINFRLLILLPLYNVLDRIIIAFFEMEIKHEDSIINSEFYKFYAPFYHTYKYPINRSVRVDDVAKSYYESASPPVKRMIELLRADCQLSEEMALDNLKERYRISKVHRMSNQIKLIISGRKIDVTVLDGFHSELLSERRLEQRRELEIKKEKGLRIMGLTIFILIEIIVYWSIVLVMTNASKI